MPDRDLSPLDRFFSGLNNALRTVVTPAGRSARPYPAAGIPETPLEDSERQHAAGLMRVNHAGEIAAQGLYQGHAMVARRADIEEQIQAAAQEEFDHLAWCEQRLTELGSRPSWLSPVWYSGSLLIGAASGICGDRWSLGFIAETEDQVYEHLSRHLDALPKQDERSRAIVDRMREEEKIHGDAAVSSGGSVLPVPVKKLMRLTARIMTTAAYRI